MPRVLVLLLVLMSAPFLSAASPRLFLAGDSTMSNKDRSSPNPEYGWGEVFTRLLTAPAMVVNFAENGRSTRSFLADGRWQKLVGELQPGDFVIIQFGHNDAKVGSERFTDPATSSPANLTRFIADVRAKSAHPILATPVARRAWRDDGSLKNTHGAYLDAVRRVARTESVPLLEMHDLTLELERAYGVEGSKKLHLWIPANTYARKPAGWEDNTHFSEYGAEQVAALVAFELRRLRLPLAAWLKPTELATDDAAPPATHDADIVVYGDSPAAFTAAIHLRRAGKNVLLVSPVKHVGGMMIEGLGSQDVDARSGNGQPIGGLAREFYERIARAYDPAATAPRYRFEAHVAQRVIELWLTETGVPMLAGVPLGELPNDVTRDGSRIATLRLLDGTRVTGRVFIDATIEVDLLARAGVSYTWGREGNARYGEATNGVLVPTLAQQFKIALDPYVTPGVAESGLLPGISPEPLGQNGAADHSSMAFCFRLSLTKDPANRIEITAPPGYDAADYELYRRYLAAGGTNNWIDGPGSVGSPVTEKIYDLGSWHDLSANLVGRNHDFPDGSYATRRRIYEEHKNFTQGLIYFLSHDPSVPAALRTEWSQWGLCQDEFIDNGGWPRRLYVRAARRMVSDYVVTEANVRKTPIGAMELAPEVPDPIGLCWWPIDYHNARTVVHEGRVYNEGALHDKVNYRPFGIAYRALVPRRTECTNLLVPAALSSSYAAYSAIRLEWTFMVLGESAAAAAALALDRNLPVQDVPYEDLRAHLINVGQIFEVTPPMD